MDDVKTSDAVTITYEPQSTPSPTRSRIAFSPDYIKTVPGILKIVEIVSTADYDSSSSTRRHHRALIKVPATCWARCIYEHCAWIWSRAVFGLLQAGPMAYSISLAKQDAVLSQGEPRDAGVNFDTYRITTASCSFSATARLSCWSLSADCSELSVKKWQVLKKNQSHI